MRKKILYFLLALPFWVNAQITLTNSSFSNGFGTGSDGVITVTTLLGSSGSLLQASPPPSVLTTDSLALVALYNATNGTNWVNKTNWLTGPVNTWYGITVEGNRVAEINLPANNLTSVLPDLSALSALKRLDVRSNNFTPSLIPATLNSITSLEYLDLSNNRYNGTITNLGSLTNLKFLSLANNTLLPNQLFPAFILNLVNLETLRLQNCRLQGSFPVGFSSLSNLMELNISLNPLSGASLEEIGSLLQLEILDLSSTSFSGLLPPSIAVLPNLQALGISNCFFNELPPVSAWYSSQLTADISNNNFDFGDLEPLAGLSYPIFINTGQKTFNLYANLISQNPKLLTGDPFALTPTVGGTQNSYQWYFNNSPIPGATNLTLDLGYLEPGEAGIYRLQVNNALVTGIALNSINLTLQVVDPVETLFTRETTSIISMDHQANSNGGYWADMDGDGDEDLFVNNLFDDVPNFLYENLGNGSFQKITSGDIVTIPDGARYVSWGDYDNDGFPDIIVGEYTNQIGSPTNDNISSLYRNNGNKTFTRIPVPFKSDGGLWADYDNDGDLDLFMNGSNANPATNKLYKNNGDGTFQLIDSWIPVTGTWYAGWVDIDNDGDLDYNITPFPTPINQIKIFRNQNGTFTEENLPVPTGTFSHRGSSWADIDGDGDLDLFAMNSVAGTSGFAESQFYINDGTGHFTMEPASTRMGVPAWAGRGSTFGDADNDGDLDLFVIHRPLLASADIVTQLFLNNGSGHFTAVPLTQQSFGFSDFATGLSLADYNNDGGLDLFIGSFDPTRPNYLYRNQFNNGNNWLKLKLVGMVSNKTAIGARVDIYVGSNRNNRQIMPSSGLQSQNSYIVHSGLGTSAQADSVIIYWPSGLIQRLLNVQSNQLQTIIEGQDNEPDVETPTVAVSNITFSDVLSTTMRVNFTPGDGGQRLAILKQGSAAAFIPVDNNFYGGDVGNGEAAVYNGSDSSFVLTNLSPATTYFVTIFEFNTDSLVTKYLVAGAPVANQATLAQPDVYVITPADGAANQAITLNVTAKALTGATTYTIELNDEPDFTGNSFVKSGTRTQNFTGLSYATRYYTRVRTNLSPAYGITTTFSTLVPNIYVTSPADSAIDRATTLSITSAALTGATLYTIEVNEEPDFSGEGFVQTGARTQSFSGLKYGHRYYTRVKTDIYPVYGDVTTFTTAIPNVFVTAPADGAINQNSTLNITARALTGATVYTIELNEAGDFSGEGFEQSGARTQNFAGLKYNTQYYARVLTDLSPIYGKTTSFTTADASLFAYVTTPANNAVDRNANLNITSNTVPGATEYTIQLSESPDFTSIDFEVTGPTRTLAFNGLKYSTTYYNRVGTDMSAQFGQVRSFTTRSAEGLAYVTSPADGAVDRNVNLNISSNNVPNATSYTIQLSETHDFSTIAFEVTGPTRTLAFSGLKYNTIYYNRVITNAEVTFDYGPVRSFTTRTAESIAYVTSPGNGVAGVNNASVNISSNTVPGAALYIIQLSEKADFSTIDFERSGPTRTLNFTGLKYGTTYYNRVLTDLASTYGEVRSFTTRTAESLAYVTSPANLAVGVNTTVNITSNTVPGASSYTIQLSELADFSVVAFENTGATRTRPFSGLTEGTTYYNRVRTDLSPEFGQVRSFTTTGTPPGGRTAGTEVSESGVETPSTTEFEVIVYPNPFIDRLLVYVESSLYKEAQIQLTDVTGRVIYRSVETTNSQVIISPEMVSGMYILQVKAGHGLKTLRVVKK